MSVPFVVGVDAGFLERVHSYDPTDDMNAVLSGENDDGTEPGERKREHTRLAELVEMLPLVEQDLLRMEAEGVRQQDVAKIFGWAQSNVSHRLSRVRQRLRFLREFPMPSEEQLRADLAGVLTEQQMDVLWDLSLTTSQTLTAVRLGYSQGKVGHSLVRAHETLASRTERHLRPYRKMAAMLLDRHNMNMLVVLPGPRGYKGREPEFIGRLAKPANDDGLAL